MSLQLHFKLSIPKPCHEDWGHMTISGKGRFCDSCSKVVMDLTGKTEQEIIAIVAKSSGGVCGRVNAEQVSNNLELKRSNSFFIQRFLAAVIIAFGSFLFTLNADAKVSPEKLKYELSSASDSVKMNKDSGVVVIKGTVVDDKTNEAIPFATVRIKYNDSIVSVATTDLDGAFKFRFARKKMKKVDVEVLYIGYTKYVMKDIELKEGKTHYTELKIKASLGCSQLQGLMVIELVDENQIPLGQFDDSPSGKTIKGNDYHSMPK